MTEYSVYVGSVFHKDTLAVAVAVASRQEPVYRGEICNQRRSRRRRIGR